MTSAETRSRLRARFLTPPAQVIASIIGAVLVGILAAQNSSMVLTAAFVVVVWVMLVRHYEAALAILLVGFYIYPIGFGLIGASRSSLSTLGFYTLLSSAALVGGSIRHPGSLRLALRRRGTLVGFTLAAWMLVNFVLLSWGNDLAAKRLGFMVFLGVIPMIVGQLITEKEMRRLYWLCVGLILLGSLLTFSNLLRIDAAAATRVSVDEDVSPLGFAYATGLTALMALVLLSSVKTSMGERLLLWMQLAGTASVLIASGSRGPIVALAVGVGVLLLRASRQVRAYILPVVLCGGLVAWLTLSLVPNVVYVRLTVVFSAASTQQLGAAFADSRGTIWRLSLSAWESSPIFGVGLGNFMQYGQGIASFSHNFILQTLTELGLIGLLILVAFLWIVGKSLVRMLRQGKTNVLYLSLAALLLYSVVSMSFSGMLEASVDFWMVSALLMSRSGPWESPAYAPEDRS